MAFATIVYVGNRRLRYLLSSSGPATVVIPARGGVSPDLITDSVAGPLKRVVRAALDGYGRIAAGRLTQEQARALLLGGVVGGSHAPSARAVVTARSGLARYAVDADVDRDGQLQLVVTTDRASTAYLDVEV